MEAYFALAVVSLTTLAAALLEARRHARPAATLRAAAVRAAETVGLTVVFFAANVGTGAAVAVAARSLGLGFVSLYLSADVTLLVLSLLQALVWQRWRETREGRS